MSTSDHRTLASVPNADIVLMPHYPFEKLLEIKSMTRCLELCNALLPQDTSRRFTVFWGGG